MWRVGWRRCATIYVEFGTPAAARSRRTARRRWQVSKIAGGSRPPGGARELKPRTRLDLEPRRSRAPRGARGLKRPRDDLCYIRIWSRPTWGAWIETPANAARHTRPRSRPTWGAWIETPLRPPPPPPPPRRAPRGARGLKPLNTQLCVPPSESRPTWGAWIETVKPVNQRRESLVAPHVGRVD